MKIYQLPIIALCTLFCCVSSQAQSYNPELFIYGKVTTLDNESYQGQIRWGKEEAFWFDRFNSSKPENENLKYLTDEELDDLNDRDYDSRRWNARFVNNWTNRDHTHTFECQFGDIKELELRSKNRVKVHLKDGSVIEVKGGSNDIGADVQVHDQEVGLIKLDWDRIDRVEFMSTPANLESKFGAPLYGTVRSVMGEYQGYLQWDHDERLSLDKLDGDTRDGDLSIDFGNIRAIRPQGRGSEVEFKSGKKLYLSGSNDVDDDNRGIIVNIPGQGRVDIPWDVFDEMVIDDNLPSTTNSYDSYKGSDRIKGVVETKNGQKFEGTLVYDLDEEFQLELLHGMKRSVEFSIPFADLSAIRFIDDDGAEVTTKAGEKMVLEDKVDVNEDNDGVLVFVGNSTAPEYIPWWDIEKIEFK